MLFPLLGPSSDTLHAMPRYIEGHCKQMRHRDNKGFLEKGNSMQSKSFISTWKVAIILQSSSIFIGFLKPFISMDFSEFTKKWYRKECTLCVIYIPFINKKKKDSEIYLLRTLGKQDVMFYIVKNSQEKEEERNERKIPRGSSF